MGSHFKANPFSSDDPTKDSIREYERKQNPYMYDEATTPFMLRPLATPPLTQDPLTAQLQKAAGMKAINDKLQGNNERTQFGATPTSIDPNFKADPFKPSTYTPPAATAAPKPKPDKLPTGLPPRTLAPGMPLPGSFGKTLLGG